VIAEDFNYFGFWFMVLPVGLFGFTMVAFPRVWREWSDRRYALSKRPIKIDALQLRSDGAWRAFGIGIILVAIFAGRYVGRPHNIGQRQPLPSIAHDPHDVDLLVDGTTVATSEPLSSTQPVTLPTSRPKP